MYNKEVHLTPYGATEAPKKGRGRGGGGGASEFDLLKEGDEDEAPQNADSSDDEKLESDAMIKVLKLFTFFVLCV